MTEYPPWSAETHDKYDSAEDIYDRNRKDTHDNLIIGQDTPVKLEANKPYTDIIDTYNKDRAQINQSVNDKLGLGQNSLPGAQQVIVATKHDDQMTEIPDHLRQLSLGEEREITKHYRKHRNCLLYTSPSPRDATLSRMPSSA